MFLDWGKHYQENVKTYHYHGMYYVWSSVKLGVSKWLTDITAGQDAAACKTQKRPFEKQLNTNNLGPISLTSFSCNVNMEK